MRGRGGVARARRVHALGDQPGRQVGLAQRGERHRARSATRSCRAPGWTSSVVRRKTVRAGGSSSDLSSARRTATRPVVARSTSSMTTTWRAVAQRAAAPDALGLADLRDAPRHAGALDERDVGVHPAPAPAGRPRTRRTRARGTAAPRRTRRAASAEPRARGPVKRYAWTGRRARRAQRGAGGGLSDQRGRRRQAFGQGQARRGRASTAASTSSRPAPPSTTTHVGSARGQRQVAVADPLVEGEVGGLEPVAGVVLVALDRDLDAAGRAGPCRSGPQVADGQVGRRGEAVEVDAAPVALVGERRRGEPVAHDATSRREARLDDRRRRDRSGPRA